MTYKDIHNNYNHNKSVADKIANGEKLTPSEKRVAYEMAQANYYYNNHNGCMGRRYKDF